MMFRNPFQFATNETLSPKKIVANFQAISAGVTDLQAQRYSYSSFVLDFDGVTSALNAAEKTFRIRAPRAYDIVGVEMAYYQATTASVILSCTATGFISLTLDALGAEVRAYTNIDQNSHVALNTNTDFLLTVSAGTVTSCKVTVHIRTDRFASAPVSYLPSEVLPVLSGDAVSATTLNSEFTDIAAAVADNAANTSDLRIQVLSRRNIVNPFPSTDVTDLLPSSARIFNSIDLYVLAAATNNLAVELDDEAGLPISNITVNGAGATTLAVTTATVTDTQTPNAPQTPASDYSLQWARSGAGVATMPLGYAVIYYT